MLTPAWISGICCLLMVAAADSPLPTSSFEAPKYGLKTAIPTMWPIAVREREDQIFVALIPRDDPDRPGVAACELGLAPASLDEYRTRIETRARRGDRPGATLIRNEVVQRPRGDQLDSVWEFHPRDQAGLAWRERTVQIIAHRQLYTFTLSTDGATFAAAQPAFDALIDAAEFKAPNTGADLIEPRTNRWGQREFRFALDLPDGWRPVLAPSQVALLFANGPAHGIWSDNLLVLAQPHGDDEAVRDLQALARELPDRLRQVEPGCEVLACQVIRQGDRDALETIVRTRRGPFSMTILERRFRGDRFDFEVKYTLESDRFDGLAPALRKTLDSFAELPGTPVVNPADRRAGPQT